MSTAVTRANFDSVVIEGSKSVPVLVDFWASWCAPCRALAPILDKIAAELDGRMQLVKLDTDAETEIAARYGIRGIPHCKLFIGGEVADEFTGALPERAVREWLEDALPSPAAALVRAAADRLARGQTEDALRLLNEAATIDAEDEGMLLTRVETLLALGRCEEAQRVVSLLESSERMRTRPVRDERRLAALKARVVLASPEGADIVALARAASAQPTDCSAKLAHAKALAATGDYERALAELLAIVRTDRTFGDDVARKTMLTIFEALGNDNDVVRRYRRELASALH